MSVAPPYGETAQPRAGTLRDQYGDPLPRGATSDLYPVSGRCDNCGADVLCADSMADWTHKRTRQIRCEAVR